MLKQEVTQQTWRYRVDAALDGAIAPLSSTIVPSQAAFPSVPQLLENTQRHINSQLQILL